MANDSLVPTFGCVCHVSANDVIIRGIRLEAKFDCSLAIELFGPVFYNTNNERIGHGFDELGDLLASDAFQRLDPAMVLFSDIRRCIRAGCVKQQRR